MRQPGLRSLPWACHSRILNCPQCTQRDLLRLGQASDPCDIQTLIWPIASQRAERLATVQVPEHDGSIIPATGQPTPIGTHLQRPDRPLMGLAHLRTLLSGELPPAQQAVAAAADQQLPTGTPGYRRDNTLVPGKGLQALPAVSIPHKQLPAFSAAATRGQPRPIGVHATLVTTP